MTAARKSGFAAAAGSRPKGSGKPARPRPTRAAPPKGMRVSKGTRGSKGSMERSGAVAEEDAAHQQALDDAARAVQGLQDDWAAAVQQHTLRIRAQFKEVQRHLRRTDLGRTTPSRKQAERLRQAVVAVRVKPGKGRGKDLRDVERVLQSVLRTLPQDDE